MTISALNGLDFEVPVAPAFNQAAFEATDFILQTPITAEISGADIPTLSTWGMILLVGILMIAATVMILRRQRSAGALS